LENRHDPFNNKPIACVNTRVVDAAWQGNSQHDKGNVPTATTTPCAEKCLPTPRRNPR